MNSLLPPGSTPLERRLAQTCSGISDLQVPLRDLWNPATCPVSFLPYLAWAFSVDRWDEGWTESVKRQVVKDAFYIHQHKGTTSAVRRVVEPFGFLIRIIEWWQSVAIITTKWVRFHSFLHIQVMQMKYHRMVQVFRLRITRTDARRFSSPEQGKCITVSAALIRLKTIQHYGVGVFVKMNFHLAAIITE